MKKAIISSIVCIFVILFTLHIFSIPVSEDTIFINEMERISFDIFQIPVDDLEVEGFQITNGIYSKLPVGSTLDRKKGIFYWLPGPGFFGEYELLFQSVKLGLERKIKICIIPKFGEFPTYRGKEDISRVSASGFPFGSFDAPVNGSTVRSSIAVTGWALDNNGIKDVKIYRMQGDTKVYIGEATLVEGARPDVANLYPDYPNNTKAGWGYMMLTNFLPNGGNGTYKILAIAADINGNSTTLGTKTIYGDNANAVKPFGAIDAPDQGGEASGSSFINWGWVLTPQPNYIPTDGSTIKVWVDGVYLGHPTYNLYRPDVANLFPEYANSDGAIGFFYINTTNYENGVHTIQWTARDSDGNTDGIGSRFFTIANTGPYTLTVTRGTGVNGTPVTGSTVYNKGTNVNYNYSLQSGYKNLVVKLDGSTVSKSGTITMNSNHTLTATATAQGTKYTLTVTRGTGVNGTPVTGSTQYNVGTTVNYNYSLEGGYINLSVILDGSTVSNSGTITMNKNHTLVANAQSVWSSIEWINIPAGNFWMGDHFDEGDPDELPVHQVYLSTYKISKYEVTFEQYDAFCNAAGRSKPDDSGWGRGQLPVIFVSWYDAKAFCDWMSQKTGENIHLPTEAQWEKAARWAIIDLMVAKRYPWGNVIPTCSMANYLPCGGKTKPVGSHPSGTSTYGVHDLAGNVWEWCSDWYSSTYYSSSPASNPTGPSSGTYRVLRGGGWNNTWKSVRSINRYYYDPSLHIGNFGFRIVQE